MRHNKNSMKLEQYIGIHIKRYRQKQGLKLAAVAQIADISQGMLSKIENAQVSTSLETLSRLCEVLGIPLSTLFSQYDQQQSQAMLVKKGEGMEVVRRGTDKGHTYHLLTHVVLIKTLKRIWSVWMMPVKNFQPSLIQALKCCT